MMLRTTKYSVAAFLCVVLGASGAFAETKAWGWRGDGTGLFPDADPPVTWGRISRTLNGLRAQAEKPKGEAAGQAASVRCGDVEDWLVIGPFDAEGSLKDVLDKAFVPGEASARPDVGEKLGDLAWRKVQANGSMLDFGRFYKDLRGKTVYAHAYIHSAADASVLLRMKSLAFRIWLNGEDIHRRDKESYARMEKTVQLRKGWNRLLVKTVAARRSDTWATIPHVAAGTAFFQMTLYSAKNTRRRASSGPSTRRRPGGSVAPSR